MPALNRHLILLRHAAAKADSADGDHGRPLKAKGLDQARDVGRWLARRGLPIDAVLLSSSLRTVETAQGLAEGLGQALPSLQESRALYLAEPAGILALIRQTPAPIGGLLVIGHNPGLSMLAGQLAPSAYGRGLVKGGLALFEIRSDWAQLSAASSRLQVWREPFED